MFFLVRHGESTGNKDACLQGSRIGGALTERGRKQAAATAMYLFDAFEELRKGGVRIVSSPSTRALQSAAPIASRLNGEVQVDNGLSELDFGDWSGVAVAQLENDCAYRQWKADPWRNAPPGGETLVTVRTRAWHAVSHLVSTALAAAEPIILVTHFFPLIGLFEILVPGQQVRCDNCSISRFELGDLGWNPTHINEVGHLAEIAPTPVRYV
jgi:probable phosphoglycerate mutase